MDMFSIYTHRQKNDISRDEDENRKKILLSRLNQYQQISSPPQLTQRDLEKYGWSQNNENDYIDNLILHAVCRGAVHFLVTNDKKIHSKARKLRFRNRFISLISFLRILSYRRKKKSSVLLSELKKFFIRSRC